MGNPQPAQTVKTSQVCSFHANPPVIPSGKAGRGMKPLTQRRKSLMIVVLAGARFASFIQIPFLKKGFSRRPGRSVSLEQSFSGHFLGGLKSLVDTANSLSSHDELSKSSKRILARKYDPFSSTFLSDRLS